MAEVLRLWFGDHPDNFLADGRFLKRQDYTLDSVANYYDDEEPEIPYKHNRLFLDNGAFAAARHGINLDPERVKAIQEDFDPDYTIPLDYPMLPGMYERTMERRWKKTQENTIDVQDTANLREVVPALHAWSRSSLRMNLRWVLKHADSDYVAVGSIVSKSFRATRTYFGDRMPNRELVDMLVETNSYIHEHSDFSVHMMGFGSSPLMLHLGFYCGIDSTDTTGYRRGAAYGKIILPGTGWRAVSDRDRTFGDTRLTPDEKIELSRCRCPVCRENQRLLASDWKARAVHNRHVLLREEAKARKMIEEGFEVYEGYVSRVFAGLRAQWMRNLWEYAKVKVHTQYKFYL
jgi:tRNA-guanine family transglycosylase